MSDDTTGADTNVVSLPIGDQRRERNLRESEIAELPIGRAPYKLGTCRHEHSVVDVRARTLTCGSCNVPLDPIDVLDRIAYEFAAPLRKAQDAEQRFRDLQASLGRLEREERNAKARVRTARTRALEFDAAAVEAACRAAWGVIGRDFDAQPDHVQEHSRKNYSAAIEAYIGALTAESPVVTGTIHA